MRTVESSLADNDPAILALPPGAVSIISDDLDSSRRCWLGQSLCPYQSLSLVESLVQLFAAHTGFVPPTAHRLLAPSDLPPVLERVAMQAQRGLHAWVAWTDERRTWFVVAEMASIPDCQDAAIRMSFFDEDGRLVSWGKWALQSERSWMLCER